MTTSLFTVEQVELVRRIRQTGISLDGIAKIYETFDRLDDELLASKVPQPQAVGDNAVDCFARQSLAAAAAVGPFLAVNQSRRTDSETSSPDSLNAADQLKTAAIWQMPFAAAAHASQLHMMHLQNGASAAGDLLIDANVSPFRRPSNHQEKRLHLIELRTQEQRDELEKLKRRDEQDVIREIREFVARNQLRQQTIASMTGISQPYVSKFLNGAAKELSERVRNLMFSWYIACKSNPELMNDIPLDGYSRSRYSQAKERLPQRRERFAFKQLHIDLLERYFKEEPYPNVYMRKEIATACNHALQIQQDGALSAKDLLSEHIVANWFSNRRKEKKRKGDCADLPRMRRRCLLYNGDDRTLLLASCGDATDPQAPAPAAATVEPSDAVAASDPDSAPLGPTTSLIELDEELAAVSNSVMALIDPYGQASDVGATFDHRMDAKAAADEDDLDEELLEDEDDLDEDALSSVVVAVEQSDERVYRQEVGA